MSLVKMTHPTGLAAEVPASAVGQLSLGGWVVDPSQDPPPCPSCGRPWPVQTQPDEAPAESGASASEPPSRRRKTSKESDL
jgi:hypothetical protein